MLYRLSSSRRIVGIITIDDTGSTSNGGDTGALDRQHRWISEKSNQRCRKPLFMSAELGSSTLLCSQKGEVASVPAGPQQKAPWDRHAVPHVPY